MVKGDTMWNLVEEPWTQLTSTWEHLPLGEHRRWLKHWSYHMARLVERWLPDLGRDALRRAESWILRGGREPGHKEASAVLDKLWEVRLANFNNLTDIVLGLVVALWTDYDEQSSLIDTQDGAMEALMNITRLTGCDLESDVVRITLMCMRECQGGA